MSGGSRIDAKPGGESLRNSSELADFDTDFESGSYEEGDGSGSEECRVSPFVEFLSASLPEGSGLFELRHWSGELEEAAVRGIQVPSLDGESRVWIKERLENQEFSDEVCLEVLARGLGFLPLARRRMIKSTGRAVLLGLYGLGGFHGISRAASLNKELTRYLNGYVGSLVPGHSWTALYVSRDTKVPLHRDLRNAAQFPTVVKALGTFVGGGLWVEDNHGLGPVCKQLRMGLGEMAGSMTFGETL